jgi:hypothetical protein
VTLGKQRGLKEVPDPDIDILRAAAALDRANATSGISFPIKRKRQRSAFRDLIAVKYPRSTSL